MARCSRIVVQVACPWFAARSQHTSVPASNTRERYYSMATPLVNLHCTSTCADLSSVRDTWAMTVEHESKMENLAAEKSGDTGDRLITDQRYNGARCTEA